MRPQWGKKEEKSKILNSITDHEADKNERDERDRGHLMNRATVKKPILPTQ